MEDQEPQEPSQVFENIDFNSSPDDNKEPNNADEGEQVIIRCFFFFCALM